MITNVKLADIEEKKLFLNTDSGFDISSFRLYCYNIGIFDNIDQNKRNGYIQQSHTIFDELLSKVRFVIERTNAWLDASKAILLRFKANVIHWEGLLLLAFIVILLRKL